MPSFSCAVSRGVMGRPPKQEGRKVQSQTFWVYPDAIARTLAFVGPGEVAAYLRKALDDALNRDGAPPFDPVTMPLKQPSSPKAKRPARRPPSP